MDHLALTGSVSDCCGSTIGKKGNSFFGVPRLFVGFAPKGLPDGESVWSPTSPLEVKVFPTSGNSYRSPRSHLHGQFKICDQSKVGLSIVDSLDDDPQVHRTVLRSLDSKIIFSGLPEINSSVISMSNPKVSTTAKSLPRNFAIFPRTNSKSPLEKSHSAVSKEIDSGRFGSLRASSLDSRRQLSSINCTGNRLNHPTPNSTKTNDSVCDPLTSTTTSVSINGVAEPLSASEIELSEDYTCIISHGPNPKTIHIYGDRILDCHPNNLNPSAIRNIDETDLKVSDGDEKFAFRDENALSNRSFEIMTNEPVQKHTCGCCEEDNCDNLLESTIFDV